MKKAFTLFLIYFVFLGLNAQKKDSIKENVKTEVVNIVTTYNPEISDANKIKKNPEIELLRKNQKKKLRYSIFSAPVASTFVPKTGVVKSINLISNERIYDNYVAAGFGNYVTPYFETYLHHTTRYKNEIGFNAKYLASEENIRNSVLNSNFSNLNAGAFYKQNERDYDWKVRLNAARNLYNWYGLPGITFTEPITNAINEEQIYSNLQLIGAYNIKDATIESGELKASYFTDSFKSTEVLLNLNTNLNFPLYAISPNLNDLDLKTSIEFLKGDFENDYSALNAIQYAITTIGLNPQYKIQNNNFILKLGFKLLASIDSENDENNTFILPDLFIQTSIVENYLNIYAGFTGDLRTNTYQNFAAENPFISPTQLIQQTLEKSNLFVGFNGKVSSKVSFNFKGIMKSEDDRPLFLRNASKSNGTNNTLGGNLLNGYEYGNSFSVVYDDVETTSILAELAYDYSKSLSFRVQGIYNEFTLENESESWNLPTTEVTFSAKYSDDKWFAGTNIFHVSERKDALYSGQFPAVISGSETIDAFVDVNLNGGYHFNDKFSTFIKLNNVLNTEYQRFANFDTQGFQILAGLSYQFNF